MNKTGNKINYSVRPKKNIERKLFCDVIRSMSYFGRLDNYRYIGFGSFFFQDFMLFHKEFSIKEGISLEIDNNAFAKNSDVIHDVTSIIIEKWNSIEDEWQISNFLAKTIISEMGKYAFDDMRKINDEIIKRCSELITNIMVSQINNCRNAVSDFKLIRNSEYDFSFNRIINSINYDVYFFIYNRFTEELRLEDTSLKTEIDNSEKEVYCNDIYSIFEAKIKSIEMELDKKIINENIRKNCINRYLFNKPYGFIDIKFSEASTAVDKIDWNNDKKSIVWLDYDEFLKPSMLDCFAKCISKAAVGSLIIISASMENDTDIRFKKFENEFENSHRIVTPIKKKECDNSEIGNTFYKVINDAAVAAISDRNAVKQEAEPMYFMQQIINCTYNDGTPMFTYAIFIYSEQDDEKDKDFPANILKQRDCFSVDENIYEINMPVLTNKEITLINQYLPTNDVDKIIELVPFIPSKEIIRYAKIYKYYPNFLDIGYYI